MEVGGYNALIGKSYGEIGAEARTMHKSQGEGRTRRRGSIYEFFETTGGEAPVNDLMDGVDMSWNRLGAAKIQTAIHEILTAYQIENPAASVKALVALYQQINTLPNSVWKTYKLAQVKEIIQNAAGLYMEAVTQNAQVIPGDSLMLQVLVNQRALTSCRISQLSLPFKDTLLNQMMPVNQNLQIAYRFKVPEQQAISQPYWLVQPKSEGMFQVTDWGLIGKPENEAAFNVRAVVMIEGQAFEWETPVQFKYTDPTKGDIYQPLAVIPAKEVKFDKEVYLMRSEKPIEITYQLIDQ